MSEKIIRIIKILNKLDSRNCPAVPKLAKELECSERTIHRDLAIIDTIIPVEYHREEKVYRFIGRSSLKKLNLNTEELMIFCAMGDIVHQVGTSLEKPFQSILSKLMLQPEKGNLKDLPISFLRSTTSNAKDCEPYFHLIKTSIVNKHIVSFQYEAMHSGEKTERRVAPLHLVNTPDGSWLLLGYCFLREAIRTFALDAMENLKETDRYFNKDDYNDDNYFDKSWSYYNGDEVTVKLRFPESVSRYILKKKKWHHSEERKTLPNGDIECSFTVAGIIEIKRWIHSWNPNVEVLEPAWFREQIEDELKQSSSYYIH